MNMKWMNLSTCEHERCLAVVRTDRRLVSQSVHVSVCSWAVTSVIYTSFDDIEHYLLSSFVAIQFELRANGPRAKLMLCMSGQSHPTLQKCGL